MKLGYRVVIVKGQPADAEKRYAVDVTAENATIKEVAAAGFRLVEEKPFLKKNYVLVFEKASGVGQ